MTQARHEEGREEGKGRKRHIKGQRSPKLEDEYRCEGFFDSVERK